MTVGDQTPHGTNHLFAGGLSSSLNKFSKLEAENCKLKGKLDKCKDDLNKANEKIDQHRASLAAAHERFKELGTQIDSDRATIERLRVRAADEYVSTKQYSFAVGQYEPLVVLKGNEKKEKAKLETHLSLS